MKRHKILAVAFALSTINSLAQTLAVKTNALYWLADANANLSVEVALSSKTSIDVLGAYKPWSIISAHGLKLWAVQPEVRWWACQKFEGHFLGLNAIYGEYFGDLGAWRYDGSAIGGAISYGYDLLLSPHWNLEAEISIGYAHLKYSRFDKLPCIHCRSYKRTNYVGPSKAALSIVYLF